MNKPNILITNDDGIYSEGIYALWEAMGEVGNPFVVAPNTEQSGSGHGSYRGSCIRYTFHSN